MTLVEWEAISRGFVSLAYATVLRSLVLACLAGMAVWLLRSRTAELRYTLWKWTLLSLLALPLLLGVTPALRRAPRALRRVEIAAVSPVSTHSARMSRGTRMLDSQADTRQWDPVMAIPAVYLFSALALLVRLGYNLISLQRIAGRSRSVSDADFREMTHEIWLRSGALLKPRIAVSDDVSVPVTFEVGDVWILLPQSWRAWDEAKVRTVLTHEMAHVRRGDAGNLLLASLTTCIFWFHPLSWFVRRQLCALAEEACDEVVMADLTVPEQYAKYLIEFAGDVKQRRGRVLAGASAMAGRSSLTRRIERLFAHTQKRRRGKRTFTALAFSIFVPLLYLTAAARLDEPQETAQIPWAEWEQVSSLSPADAANLAAEVEANPEDLNTRMELLLYYGHSTKQDRPYTDQLVWFIEHEPSVQSLPMASAMFPRANWLSEASKRQILSAWEKAMEAHSNSVSVLFNAASVLEEVDPERGLRLFQELEVLNPPERARYQSQTAIIHAAAELHRLHPDGMLNNIQITDESGDTLRALLAESNDPDLLTQVGTLMVEFNPRNEIEQTQLGLGMIQQAIKLDPGNPKWKEALESAKAEPARKLSHEQLRETEPVQEGTIRIGSEVAEAALVSKVYPVYPSAAISARIQGTVEFSITVGPEGRVTDIKVVRGHPLFVQPAKEAVSKWVYHPALQDGKAIPFLTEVIVPFKLP